MFQSARSLSQDRIVLIRLPLDDTETWGTCPLDVCVHHLLEIIVTVRRKTGTIYYGDGTIVQIVRCYDKPGIALLDALGNIHLDIRQEPSKASMTMSSLLRVRAKRYGGQVSLDSLKKMESCMKVEDIAVLEEIQIKVCTTS